MRLYKTVAFLLTLLASLSVLADAQPQILFVNGIFNSEERVQDVPQLISEIVNADQKVLSLYYNVKLVHNERGTHDLQELFLLKVAEEHYLDSLLAIACPYNQHCTVSQKEAKKVRAFLYDPVPEGNHFSTTTEKKDRFAVYMQQVKRAVVNLADEIKKYDRVVVVAHSQGNIIANLAYAYLAVEWGDSIQSRVRIVNVANTSAVSLHGLDLTHDGDLALHELRKLPVIYGWRRTTDYCKPEASGRSAICAFALMAKPTLVAPSRFSSVEDKVMLHSFKKAYLSDAEVSIKAGMLKDVTFSDWNTSFAGRFRDVMHTALESF